MNTPFLTYELLTPETADPVVIRITGQRVRYFLPFKASNGVVIGVSRSAPQYFSQGEPSPLLLVWSIEQRIQGDSQTVPLPLSDWPAVKQAIRELNEYYGETNMKEEIDKTMNTLLSGRKEVGSEHGEEIEPGNEPDTYEFDLNAFDYNLIITERILRVTHKKPKVCVEWRLAKTVYHNELAGPPGQGELYRVVQFRVTGWTCLVSGRVEGVGNCEQVSLVLGCPRTRYIEAYGEDPPSIYIGSDAKGCWSQPVLLPESIFSRLDEITKALEEKANG